MGADRTVVLKKKITPKQLAELEKACCDVSLIVGGKDYFLMNNERPPKSAEIKEIHFHYAYWGEGHCKSSESFVTDFLSRCDVKSPGRWSY